MMYLSVNFDGFCPPEFTSFLTREYVNLAKPNRLKEIEEENGASLDDLIPALLNQLGSQKEVAARLGVSPATISTWLAENGYRARITWEKDGDDNGNGNRAA